MGTVRLTYLGHSTAGRRLMTEPPLAFAREAARLAPDVDVRILEPGSATTL